MEQEKHFVKTVQAHIGHTKYRTVIKSGEFDLIVDEPETAGGAGLGPDPGSLLLASLASCTAITLRMYLDRKMWAVEEIIIDVELFKNENVTQFKCKLSFVGDLTQEQKERLIHIANACPIHKMLTGSISIETSLNTMGL